MIGHDWQTPTNLRVNIYVSRAEKPSRISVIFSQLAGFDSILRLSICIDQK